MVPKRSRDEVVEIPYRTEGSTDDLEVRSEDVRSVVSSPFLFSYRKVKFFL